MHTPSLHPTGGLVTLFMYPLFVYPGESAPQSESTSPRPHLSTSYQNPILGSAPTVQLTRSQPPCEANWDPVVCPFLLWRFFFLLSYLWRRSEDDRLPRSRELTVVTALPGRRNRSSLTDDAEHTMSDGDCVAESGGRMRKATSWCAFFPLVDCLVFLYFSACC